MWYGRRRSKHQWGPRLRARACTHLRECWSAVGQSGATAFPPPLRGRDRERGTTRTAFRWPNNCEPAVGLEFILCGTNFALGALSPPLSLSLPRKGGGNRVACTFVTHATCLRHTSELLALDARFRGHEPSLGQPHRKCADAQLDTTSPSLLVRCYPARDEYLD